MSKELNKCDWCKGKTNMPNSFTAMSPIQPKMEEQIQKAINKYGNKWWVGLEKDNKELLDTIEENVSVCCAVTMDPDDVLELIDKLRKILEKQL